MSDLDDAPGLQDYDLHVQTTAGKVTFEQIEEALQGMTQEQLLILHSKVETKLEGVRLEDVNLVTETLLQLQKAKILQEKAATDRSVPMNQRAQVQNSLSNVISTLAKVQTELHSAESIKRLKAAVIRVVKTLPKDAQDNFFMLMEGEITQIEKDMET